MKPRQSYGPLTAEQRATVEANIGLAYKVARLLENRGIVADPDDALHIGHLALMRAVQIYGQFAGRYELSTIVFVQSRSFLGNHRNQEVPRGYRGRAMGTPPSILAFDESYMSPATRRPLEAVEARDILEAVGPGHARTLRAFYFDGRSAVEIGEAAGVTKQRIHQRLTAGLEQARRVAGGIAS
jgi:RNA polymerase sigma factor (sigma-70 family)